LSSDPLTVIATRTLVAFGGLVIVLGTFATAAGPHSGGAGTGDVVRRLDAFGAHTLRSLIHLHGHLAAALGFAAIAVWAIAWRRRANGLLRRSLTVVCVLIGLQGVIGLWQYHTNLPAGLVWVHASLPAAIWGVLVWSWLAAGRPAREPEPARVASAPAEVPALR
jgi:cytochrome c oxidase assembly protein subunit 15